MAVANLFDDVPVFVAVVDCGSFAEAARRLHLSRSAVGKAVARLEERLAARLFQRTTRNKGLTDDGQTFYAYCQQAVTALQAGQAVLETGRKTISGTLRVTMPVLFGRMCVAPVLLRLAVDNPELSLELDFRDHHINLIDAGMDLAIRIGPTGLRDGLAARCVARNRTVICAAPGYIARHGALGGLDQIDRHASIVYSRDGHDLAWQFPRSGGTATEVTPRSRIRLNDLGAMHDAVLAGQGIAWLPDWLVAANLANGSLVALLPDEPGRLEEVNVMWPDAPYLPSRVRAAVDAIAAHLRLPGVSSVA